MHHLQRNWFFYLLVFLVLFGGTNRYTRFAEYGVFAVYLAYAAPWVVARASGRRARGVRVPVNVTYVSPRTQLVVGLGGPGAPVYRAYCEYDFQGRHYSGVTLSGMLPSSTGPAEALIDPDHPNEPYLERSPLAEMTFWPVLLVVLALMFGVMAVRSLIA